MNGEEFKNMVDGKNVVIVGPAGSIHGSKQGDAIEGFDIIMRFNRAVPVPVEAHPDVGKRTDILCNCLEPSPIGGGKPQPQIWKDNGVKLILSPYPSELSYIKKNFDLFKAANNGIMDYHCTDLEFFKGIEEQVKTRPNSGILGIMYMLKFNIQKVYVTGFTFCRDGYRPGYKPGIGVEMYRKLANQYTHRQAPQEEYFRQVYQKDGRIEVDKPLEDILGARP